VQSTFSLSSQRGQFRFTITIRQLYFMNGIKKTWLAPGSAKAVALVALMR